MQYHISCKQFIAQDQFPCNAVIISVASSYLTVDELFKRLVFLTEVV